MALYRCMSGGSGGGVTQINLWTIADKSVSSNASPITLSDAVENYEQIMITYRSSTTDSFERSVTVNTSEVLTDATTKYVFFGGHDGSSNYVSYVVFNGGTSVNIGNCYQVRGTGNNNNKYYPVSIDGFK